MPLSYDYVLVMRGNSYARLANVLVSYRKKLVEAGICIKKTYTIAGINLKQSSAWQETLSLKVSIRLSCTSQMTDKSLIEIKGMKEALWLG